jgi:hypothetical protein
MRRRSFVRAAAAAFTVARSGLVALPADAPGAGVASLRLPPTTSAAQPADWARLRQDFVEPPFQYKTRPLWFWNAVPNPETTAEIMQRSVASGYAGFGILPTPKSLPFMTPEYLAQYRVAVETAARNNQKMCLYDEFWFPSGSAGGALAKEFPDALSHRLDMVAVEVKGPSQFAGAAPAGKLMSVVAMNVRTLARVSLSSRVRAGSLSWQVPSGDWKVLWFVCVPDGARGLVDYLEPESVKKYISLTYEKYYAALGSHFGKAIDSAFYDEPTMHWLKGGRAWTPAFNTRFRQQNRFDPEPLYPALWMDIGPETAAARNALFGFRAELYASGFTRTLNQWCAAHGIALTGHQDQEEIVNPVGLCGDLIKAFRDQDIPGVDQISNYGRGSKAYKVVSSAAYNYDRPLVMTECYGAMKDLPIANLYKDAMDQFAKGINWMIPHAVWYDPTPKNITFPQELSYRSPVYGPALPAYNEYMARLHRILQRGRHVADIAVLYPIATLQAGYRFDVGVPYEGGIVPPEADYMDVGEILALKARRDYTFLHPETLSAKCEVRAARLRLNNRVNFEEYRVVIIPGSQAIHWSSLQKIKAFFDAGGIVIATTRLPGQSAEFGKDNQVRQAIQAMFEPASAAPAGKPWTVRRNGKGGAAYFLPALSPEALSEILSTALPDGDVVFEKPPAVSGGNLSYIHKHVDGRDVYFFANSSNTPVDCAVRLRGLPATEEWNPHTGSIAPATAAGVPLHLVLPPVESRFFVSPARA